MYIVLSGDCVRFYSITIAEFAVLRYDNSKIQHTTWCPNNSHCLLIERQQFSEKLSEHLCAKMLTITEAMNNHEQFVPKVPAPTELDTIYDTSLPDVQPFLFKVIFCSCCTAACV